MTTNVPSIIKPEASRHHHDYDTLPVAQADTDAQLVDLWVRRHESRNTRRNYQRQAERFLAFVNRPLAAVRLGELLLLMHIEVKKGCTHD